jgi:cytochrome c biogenesis protein CcmG/thiol:disulfide interchange protein DsbE
MPEPAGARPEAFEPGAAEPEPKLDEVEPKLDEVEPPAGRLALWIAAAVGVLSLGLIVVLATADGGGGGVDTELVGEVAPLVSGQTLDGEIYDLDERRGQWVLVNFFQTTCIPCVREHPELIEFSDRHARAGDAEVVSVVFDDTTTAVEEFFTEFGGDWPVVVGDTGTIALDYGVVAVPESYLVAPSGRVAWKGVGGVTADGLDDVIATLTGEAA